MNTHTKATALKVMVLLTAAMGAVFFVYALIDTTTRVKYAHTEPVISMPVEVDIQLKKTDELPAEKLAIPTLQKMHKESKIQVAILLDVSNSMDGLIDQAKAQLWNMVNTMGNVRCEGVPPAFELALYEYGRPDNGEAVGYIKQLHGFTNNLDAVSASLFGIKTNGGAEYCPQVIVRSVDELPWDKNTSTYKVLFIAGNESFRQGNVPWTAACDKAKQAGVIVNTIYCGDRDAGIREYWNLGAECGNGSYTNINQDAGFEEIPTPYDSVLFALNEKLNGTYIAYGTRGAEASAMQTTMDTQNYGLSKSAAAKRVEVKGKKELYRNDDWDMVDAYDTDKELLKKLPKEALPVALQQKTEKEITALLNEKAKERAAVQKEIAQVSISRNNYIKAEKEKVDTSGAAPTLESEIEKIIRSQVQRFNMVIK